jgi:hypothetical protein
MTIQIRVRSAGSAARNIQPRRLVLAAIQFAFATAQRHRCCCNRGSICGTVVEQIRADHS